jgi:DNA primase
LQHDKTSKFNKLNKDRRKNNMGKISPVSIKYMVYANFEAVGALEKPDVIGALFGQTEGLLGSELEMRELQKEGKIGRIDVELKSEGGKTTGEIKIPTALDKAETALIAAAIETIDRIGPTDAKIEVRKIEDIRGEKRGFIVDRAKKLLAGIEGSNDTREMADNLKEQSRMAKLQDYGAEKLPAGDISGHEIIVVEGRADVVTLLKNGVNNVIGMNGTKLPEGIKELSYDKEVTLFVDGDRGGKLIAKNVSDNARVDFVAVAPDGKEVEELVGKEILTALRRKVPVGDFFREDKGYREERPRYESRNFRERRFEQPRYEERPRYEQREQEQEGETRDTDITDKEKEKLKEMMKGLPEKSAYLLDSKLELIREVSSATVGSSIVRSRKKVFAVVMNGLVTAGVIRYAEEKNVKVIAAKNFASTETKIKLLSL